MSNVLMHTNFGDITIELNYEKAPITAANFEQYVRDGFYDGVIFHRVIDGFMVQGGGFDVSMDQKKLALTSKMKQTTASQTMKVP